MRFATGWFCGYYDTLIAVAMPVYRSFPFLIFADGEFP